MQTKAVIKAAIKVKAAHPDWDILPEIMIPLVGEVKEFTYLKEIVVKTADALIKEAGSSLKYLVGTNDLTQMTFGFSRDDAGSFLDEYYQKKIFESDPFARIDQIGVGKLMEMAVELGKKARPDIKLGICGEHGGDPSSVEFCHKIGLNYVSCSPFRVPIARLAAAQAALKD
jgi:pyruvate,orthophosphate dikinase